jgi:hypothetical protein
MKHLLEAFLELPTWQGFALIAAFVAFEGLLAWCVAWAAWRRGVRDAEMGLVERLHEKQRDTVRI